MHLFLFECEIFVENAVAITMPIPIVDNRRETIATGESNAVAYIHAPPGRNPAKFPHGSAELGGFSSRQGEQLCVSKV